MRKLGKLAGLVLLVAAYVFPCGSAASEEHVKGMFVVVTSAEPQTQLMAMVLSTQAMKKGKHVRILLCGPGGDLALRNGREVILKPKDKSPQMLLRKLIANHVVVQVCPLYLPNKGASLSDLVDGVTQAKPPVIAESLLEPGVKLFTF